MTTDDEWMEGVPDNIDGTLAMMIASAHANNPEPAEGSTVTLYVRGSVISGRLISEARYLEITGEVIAAASPQGLVWVAGYDNVAAEMAELAAPTQFLYLADVIVAQSPLAHRVMAVWLPSVDAWGFGIPR